MYLISGVVTLFLGAYALTIFFWLMAVVWYFIYPMWQRRRYVKHYQEWVMDAAYKKDYNQPYTVQFDNDVFSQVRGENETKFATKEMLEMNEIGSHIFVKFDGSRVFIFPKNKIENIDTVIDALKEIAKSLNVPYNVELDWKWK